MPPRPEYVPSNKIHHPIAFLEPHEVAAKLKHCKKPKSTVQGDIFPQLVAGLYDLLAVPLCKIFNLVLHTNEWPSTWKTETVTVIPKSGKPQGWEDCRNISCTPLFLKVLEGIVLERINDEVKIDEKQYGRVKKVGAEHLLIEAWERILQDLDDNRGCVSLTSIDFSKAFNRMAHQACLDSFKKKGASQQTFNVIGAFLTGRVMQVQLDSTISSTRPIFEGSPQGCVMANTLFCATIEGLQDNQYESHETSANIAYVEKDHDQPSLLSDFLLEINDDVSDCYVVPFEHNGVRECDFTPTITSSPTNLEELDFVFGNIDI